jgi:hypothetical protein
MLRQCRGGLRYIGIGPAVSSPIALEMVGLTLDDINALKTKESFSGTNLVRE